MGGGQHLELVHLEGVSALLDQLQAGFVVVDPEGAIERASFWARALFRRSALRADAAAWLGAAHYDALVAPVLAGASAGERWREIELAGREEGVVIHVSVRSTAVAFPDGRRGALLSLHDISGEVGLHQQNKALLAEQRHINERLRQEIAAVLREHEDDLAQFSEILQIAPAIFASFLAEAEGTLDAVDAAARASLGSAAITEALRSVHTLKGNARSLGLNFIGGRAHSVEDVLVSLRDREVFERDRIHLAELATDLRRAVERASFVRSHLAAQGARPGFDLERHRLWGQVQDALDDALAHAGADARAAVERARELFARASSLCLQELFEYVKATVAQVARERESDCPLVETRGGTIAVPPRAYETLAEALPHLARNAVVHGLERAGERLARGKSASGTIWIEATLAGDELQVTVRDDGRGLDLPRLSALAAARGLPAPDTAEALLELLCEPGLSTAAELDYDSGRGVGTTAARAALEAAGGSLAVESEPGAGTTFTLRLRVRARRRSSAAPRSG